MTTAVADDAEDATLVPALRTKPLGARRLDQARAFIRRFWAPTSEAALDLVILWAAGTHMTGPDRRLLFENYPRVYFGAKTPEAGKSTILMLLAGPMSGEQDGLCARGEWTSDASAPAMRALLDTEASMLALDESDTKQGSGAFPAEVRNILNMGYMTGATVTRGGTGQASKSHRFRIDGPIAMGGMWDAFLTHGDLKAVRSRTLMVPCAKPGPGVDVAMFRRRDHGEDLRRHGEALAKWAEGVKWDIAEARPDLDGFRYRDHQLIEPLLAVADAAGGDWPQRARNAIKVIMRGFPDETDTEAPTNAFELLLHDLGRVWVAHEERLATREIAARLRGLPGSGWTRYGSPQATGKEIAEILAPEGVVPQSVRLDPQTVVRGYKLADMMRIGLAPMPKPVDLEELPF